MKISEIFDFKGRGTIVAPGVDWDAPVTPRVGQTVELRRPDNSRVQVVIRGIEHLNPNPQRVTPLLFCLPPSDLPIGTEIWTLD